MKVLILKLFTHLLNVIYAFFKTLKTQKKVVMINTHISIIIAKRVIVLISAPTSVAHNMMLPVGDGVVHGVCPPSWNLTS